MFFSLILVASTYYYADNSYLIPHQQCSMYTYISFYSPSLFPSLSPSLLPSDPSLPFSLWSMHSPSTHTHFVHYVYFESKVGRARSVDYSIRLR